ncbi:MAG TPA: site-specific integrase [Anaerolineae bacterium]
MIERDNYLLVKEYLAYQAEVLLRDPETVNRKRLWLRHILRWADNKPFHEAPGVRPVFPRYLATAQRAESSGKALTAVGVERGCQEARAFFEWIGRTYPRQHRAITPTWISTLQPPAMPTEPPREHQAVTLEAVRRLMVVRSEPGDLMTMRDKAAAAFLFLSGARASAFCTLTLECVNIAGRTIKQYPTLGVRTKNRKAAVTRLLEIPDLLDVVAEWDAFVREQLPATAPWYPVIDISLGEQLLTADKPGRFRTNGLGKNIRALFEKAGLPPMSPHKFRHGHAVYGLKAAREISDLKAVSMNLMHSSIGITDSIYAVLSENDMQERIARLGQVTGSAEVSKDRIKALLIELLSQLDTQSDPR